MIGRRLLLAAPALALVTGCGPPAPPAVDLTVKASPDLNRSEAGTPLSVAVRLYSLNERGRFASADAYALMDHERAVLGPDGARSEEIVLRPGETRKLVLAPKPGSRYLGVAVLFHDIDRAQWRAVAPIAASGSTRLVLAIGSNRAELEAA
ncbi:type VI secretion system lipoprotein TssJ [Reyranella sp.]|jgi:type VI secretion system protein VasD|uniref:type VI secretion system lipoprotein TssJ n=1 Tax=Reyranella sp. TaxID=1929291 RepID=UPI002F92399A